MTSESFTQQVQSAGILAAKRILICRPEPAASELANALSAFGAECQTLPMLHIEAIEVGAEERQHIMNLDHYQHVIVISQHAAELGIEQIDTYWPQVPVEQQWYAIGRKTAESLETADLNIAKPGHDLSSEKLLEHAAFRQVKGDKILILKGMN